VVLTKIELLCENESCLVVLSIRSLYFGRVLRIFKDVSPYGSWVGVAGAHPHKPI
jgi:hypothetical protein